MERKRKRRQRCICTNGAVILLLLAMSASSFGVDSNNPSLFPDTVSSVDAALDWDSRRDRNCFAAVESQTWASLNVIVSVVKNLCYSATLLYVFEFLS